jgi:eukaryotic-like serine/threonine-protein kinase
LAARRSSDNIAIVRAPVRIEELGPLPGEEGSGAALGIALFDGEAPQPVVIRPVPDELAGDPVRRESLQRALRRVAGMPHPNLLPSFGLETVNGRAARIEAFVEGVTLRAAIDAGGRMPPEIAARVVADACAAMHFAHGEGEGGAPFVHGHLRPEAILVSASGVTLVSGLGASVAAAALPSPERYPWIAPEQVVGSAGAAGPETDVYLLGLALHACLSGEAPFPPDADPDSAVLTRPAAPLLPLGVPGGLASVVEKALAKKAQDRYPGPAALGRAIEQAVGELAPPPAVAAYLDVLLPADQGARAARRALVEKGLAAVPAPPQEAGHKGSPEEVAEELIVGEPTPPGGAPAPKPRGPVDLVSTADIVVDRSVTALPRPAPAPDLVTTRDIMGEGSAPFMVPRPPVPPSGPSPRRNLGSLVVAAGIAVAGLAIGYGLSQHGGAPVRPAPPPAAAPISPPAAAPEATAAPTPAPIPMPVEKAPKAAARPAPEPAAKPPAGPPSVDVSSDPAGDVFVDGKRVGRTPLARNVSRGKHKVRVADRALGIDQTKVVEVKSAHVKVRFAFGRASLTVTAPEGAEVFVNGKRVGTGSTKDIGLYEGSHKLVVTLGPARHEHAFSVGPGETYTYEVSKTGP